MKSLRATEKNQEDDVTNASDDNDDCSTNSIHSNNKDKKKTKKRNKSLEKEYLVAQLESLYDASAAATAATSSSSSLLESLTEDYDYDVSSSSPGESLLYGEKNVVVLGDWMGWEEGGSCLGDYCGDESEVSIVLWTVLSVQLDYTDVLLFAAHYLSSQHIFLYTHHP